MINIQRVILLGLSILLASCVAIQPFPYAVRAGDTITLAIGSLDGVNKGDISITYFPDQGSLPTEAPVDVTAGIRSVFNIYPDKRSKTFWDTRSGVAGTETMAYIENISGHSAWQTVLAVDLPSSLPTGTGHFVINMGPAIEYPRFVTEVGNVQINAQILQAGGNADDFEYHTDAINNGTTIGNLGNLEQLRQVIIRTPGVDSLPINPIAAAEFNLEIPMLDSQLNDVSNLVLDKYIAVVLDDKISYERNQTGLAWSRSGSTFKVIITSSTGNQDAKLLRFSVLLSDYVVAAFNGWSLADTASLTSVKYYDLNGNEITGQTPEVIVR